MITLLVLTLIASRYKAIKTYVKTNFGSPTKQQC
jgi:hypothetical protein